MNYREDFFRMLDGKTPVADVPLNKLDLEGGNTGGVVAIMPEKNDFATIAITGRNGWGVPYQIDDFGTGFMPAPNQVILPDVTKWKDIIKAPYDYDYDWASAAERDLARQTWNPETQVASLFAMAAGYFVTLSGIMSFEGMMIAMYDEPEAMHELLDYMCDYDIWLVENYLENYKGIDIMGMGDDNATEINPFISYDMFKEFLYPRYKRVADKIKEYGKIISYHNCGRCEDFMDDMVGIGVQIWNCATPVNDLMGFKKKHNNKIILEFLPRFYFEADEEKTRQQVRDQIDKYAPGGAFVWAGDALTINQEKGAQLNSWIYDEVEKYGKDFYL